MLTSTVRQPVPVSGEVGKGKGGYGHRLIVPSYTASTKLYRLLQSNVVLLQDMVGEGRSAGRCVARYHLIERFTCPTTTQGKARSTIYVAGCCSSSRLCSSLRPASETGM